MRLAVFTGPSDPNTKSFQIACGVEGRPACAVDASSTSSTNAGGETVSIDQTQQVATPDAGTFTIGVDGAAPGAGIATEDAPATTATTDAPVVTHILRRGSIWA